MKTAKVTAAMIVLGLAILFTPPLPAGQAEEETAAMAAAQKWLELIDEGKYADSWEQAAEYFKGGVTKGRWEEVLNGVRRPLGKVLSRNVMGKQFTTRLPGAPDGKYVVIQFLASFEGKKSSVETITPMLDKDGKWRVSGYFIK